MYILYNYTLSISRGGGGQAPAPPPGFATELVMNYNDSRQPCLMLVV